MENIVLVGSSGHASVVVDAVEQEGRFRIVGLLDSYRQPAEVAHGYRILGPETELPSAVLEYGVTGLIVAVGDNLARSRTVERLRTLCPDIRLATAIHPAATVARNAVIGDGTVVMAGAVVNPGCRIGLCCIVNTSSSLDHDSAMGDYSSLAPHAATGGRCLIGSYSAIGMGAVLIEKSHVGEHTVIGAGAVVLHDIESFAVAYGTPAKTVRQRTAAEAYLR